MITLTIRLIASLLLVFSVFIRAAEPAEPEDFDATWSVEASVTGRAGATESRVRFSMRRKKVGTYKGCLMTYMIQVL